MPIPAGTQEPVSTESTVPVLTAAPSPAQTSPLSSAPDAGLSHVQMTILPGEAQEEGGMPPDSPELLEPAVPQPSTPIPSPSPNPTPYRSPIPTYPVTEMRRSGYVTTNGVNLRKGPGKDYDIVDELDYHQEVVITGVSGEWYRLSVDGHTGFAHSDYVEKGSVPTPPSKPMASPTPKSTASPTPKPLETPAPTPERTPVPAATPAVTPLPSAGQGIPGNDTDAEIYMAAQLIYLEGKGQTREGFEWLANVLWNRCNSPKFGGTIEEEIFRGNGSQFSVAKDREKFLSTVPSEKAMAAAKAIFLEGKRVIPENVLYFRSVSRGESWDGRTFYASMGGNNYFY